MSHYQHNFNAPQFPPGVHMSHYSLTNTTLIGQEMQQRLWEKYWGQQYPVPPSPYMWPHPGMCFHGYPYGVPNAFHLASMHGGFEQSHHPGMQQNGGESNNFNSGRGVGKCSESFAEKDVLVEVLEEGNSWSNNEEQRTAKQHKSFKTLCPKIVDPVTDDLNWNTFSVDLADGIVVSILDSFALELPVLDFTMVQSVFEELDRNLPPPTADQIQQIMEKDIISLSAKEDGQSKGSLGQGSEAGSTAGKALEQSSSLASSGVSGLEKDNVSLPQKQLCRKEDISVQGSEENSSTGKALEYPSPSAISSVNEKDEDSASLPPKQLCRNDDSPVQSNEADQTTDKPLGHSSPLSVLGNEKEEDNASLLQKQLCRNDDSPVQSNEADIADKPLGHSSPLSVLGNEKDKNSASLPQKDLRQREKDNSEQSNEESGSSDKAVKHSCSLATSSMDVKDFSQDCESLPQTQHYQSKHNSCSRRYEPWKTTDEALANHTSSIPYADEAKEVKSTVTRVESSSCVLNTAEKTLEEKDCNSNVPFTSTKNANTTGNNSFTQTNGPGKPTEALAHNTSSISCADRPEEVESVATQKESSSSVLNTSEKALQEEECSSNAPLKSINNSNTTEENSVTGSDEPGTSSEKSFEHNTSPTSNADELEEVQSAITQAGSSSTVLDTTRKISQAKDCSSNVLARTHKSHTSGNERSIKGLPTDGQKQQPAKNAENFEGINTRSTRRNRR